MSILEKNEHIGLSCAYDTHVVKVQSESQRAIDAVNPITQFDKITFPQAPINKLVPDTLDFMYSLMVKCIELDLWM